MRTVIVENNQQFSPTTCVRRAVEENNVKPVVSKIQLATIYDDRRRSTKADIEQLVNF